MAVFAGCDLKKWRQEQGMAAEVLAERISCDVTTLYRYESGKLKPNPDVMYEICNELGDINRWMDWMRTEYPASYGRVHPEMQRLSFEGTMMKMFAEVSDLQTLQYDAMKDGADGRIDDQALRSKLIIECTEAVGALQRFTNALISQGNGGEPNG